MLDNITSLKAGIIFTWHNYPQVDDKIKDRRWFVCLGNSVLHQVIFQITTTTKFEYYEKNGDRYSHNYFILEAGCGGLEQRCVVDITANFRETPHRTINDNKADINLKDFLSPAKINELVKHIKCANNIPKRVKDDIFTYLINEGFTINTR